MYLYNSATHKKAEFQTHTPGRVEMYTCGPTVYHFAHIGNLRSYIMEDVLEKALRYEGYNVNRVMNITDVGHLSSDADTGEDKMVKGAKREHKTVMEIAQYYTDAFFADCKKLNIKRPDVVQPATGCIDEYIKIIAKLMDTGYAYFAGGNVYFDTSRLDHYYVFNDHDEDDLAVGVREGVEEDTNKRNKNDFVLWFTKSKFENQALKWDSPWGIGYPGWHIECSGISMKYNGEYLDLHCGGVDNAFPHHTNEIAQSESYLGHAWCPQWFHVHHLNTSTGKMSKSKGEFLTVSLLEEKGYDPLIYRFFCLQSHYRKALVFTWENLDNAKIAYDKLIARIAALNPENGSVDEASMSVLKEKFQKALARNSSMRWSVHRRRSTPGVLKALGVQAVIAKSFARIFFRNAINIGLPAIVCKDLPDAVENGDTMILHMSEGTAEVNGKTYTCTKLPEYMQNILNQGGLIASLNREEE